MLDSIGYSDMLKKQDVFVIMVLRHDTNFPSTRNTIDFSTTQRQCLIIIIKHFLLQFCIQVWPLLVAKLIYLMSPRKRRLYTCSSSGILEKIRSFFLLLPWITIVHNCLHHMGCSKSCDDSCRNSSWNLLGNWHFVTFTCFFKFFVSNKAYDHDRNCIFICKTRQSRALFCETVNPVVLFLNTCLWINFW